MAGNTLARPWTAWLGGRRQAKDQTEAEAS
jgi:hypothetical protein